MISNTIYSGKLFPLVGRQKNSNELDFAGNYELKSRENSEKNNEKKISGKENLSIFSCLFYKSK